MCPSESDPVRPLTMTRDGEAYIRALKEYAGHKVAPKWLNQLIAELDATRSQLEQAQRERDETRTVLCSLCVWGAPRTEFWQDAAKSVRAKLAENAAQIVDLMHARDEAQRECAEAEIRARRAESTAEHCAKLAGAARAEAAKLRGDIKRWHDALTMPLGPLTRKELRQQMLDAVASTEPITAADMEWAKRALSTPPAGLP